MACESLTSITRVCNPEGILGGLGKLYMMTFADAQNITGTDKIYTTAISGLISEIGVKTGKMFVDIALLQSTAGLNEELTKNLQTGTAFLTRTLTTVVQGLSTENRAWVDNVINQPVIAIVKTRSGSYFAAGLDGEMELATLAGGTGIAEGDLQGYTLTFTGVSGKLIPGVDPTIIADLLLPAEAP